MLINHHVKYLEIDGYDEYKEMDMGEHRRLHNRLRREGKCNVSPEELNKISIRAHRRTKKCKENRVAYCKKNLEQIYFDERMMIGIRLREVLAYNHKTGLVSISSFFIPNNKKELFFVDVKEKEIM